MVNAAKLLTSSCVPVCSWVAGDHVGQDLKHTWVGAEVLLELIDIIRLHRGKYRLTLNSNVLHPVSQASRLPELAIAWQLMCALKLVYILCNWYQCGRTNVQTTNTTSEIRDDKCLRCKCR